MCVCVCVCGGGGGEQTEIRGNILMKINNRVIKGYVATGQHMYADVIGPEGRRGIRSIHRCHGRFSNIAMTQKLFVRRQ